jgi:tyrosyl-tRNA synthetase
MTEYRIRLAAKDRALLTKVGDIKTKELLDISPTAAEKWTKFLVRMGQAPSKTEADRLVKQGAVEINDQTLTDIASEIAYNVPASFTVRVGKKNFFRITVEPPAK